MRKVYLLIFIAFFSQQSYSQIVQWTFETSLPATAGPHAAEIGTGSASVQHAGASSYTNPAGNGSAESFSATNWTTTGDYWQFQFATTGYQDITLTWDAISSGTGPRDFKVQYSTDGTSFTDATGTNSTYQVGNTPTWTSATYNASYTRTLDLSGVAALNNAAAVYIRLTLTSQTSSNGGTIAGAGTSRVDNVTINGNVFTSNTITVSTLSAVTFNLVDCFTSANGTVDFTSTGTFTTGNVYTAQLSDAAGSFASPTNIGTLSSTANAGTINFTIPAGTPTGLLYRIRIRSSNPLVTSSNFSLDITINQGGSCSSSATDYFQSRSSGNWNTTTTWESSATGLAGSWINATLTPTNVANTITILNTHTVTVTASVSVDQVVIQSGGMVDHTGGTITVEDGTGDDIDIQAGGIFRLAVVGTPPAYGAGSPTINVATGGTLRVSAGGMTGAGTGVNVNNIIYQHQSILEWMPSGTGSFSSGGVTYFPNVNTTTIPIFRSNNSLAMQVGAAAATTFNGVFEAANANVTWENAGTKTFRNGIRGTGNVIAATVTNPSGMFVINGTTAELGGTGSLIAPNSGIQIGSASGTIATISDNKVINGNVSLVSTGTYVELGASNLTITGTVTGGSATSYIRTNGTGSFILNNITALRDAPIGRSTYNPLTITHADGLNWTLRVEDAVAVADPTFAANVAKAVQREWHITPSTNPPATGADIVFQWDDSDPSQVGGLYNNAENVQIWHEVSQGSPWGDDWLAVGTAQAATGTPPGVRTANFTNWTWFSPFAISNISGPLPVKLASFTAIRINDRNARINWELAACCSRNARFELEKSTDGTQFTRIALINGSETSRFYDQYDINLGKGITYYRLKTTDVDGKVTYSRTAAVINGTNGLVVAAPAPNPVNDATTVVVTVGRKENIAFVLADINGRIVRQWNTTLPEGTNNITVPATALAGGTYYLTATAGEAKAVVRFVKQ